MSKSLLLRAVTKPKSSLHGVQKLPNLELADYLRQALIKAFSAALQEPTDLEFAEILRQIDIEALSVEVEEAPMPTDQQHELELDPDGTTGQDFEGKREQSSYALSPIASLPPPPSSPTLTVTTQGKLKACEQRKSSMLTLLYDRRRRRSRRR